jgi:succinate dehydrogenase / fumarate reductase cytochrome b subunit
MASSGTAQKPRPRPLSPHATVYKITLTMAMSFAHRVTGIGLYIGVLLLAWFLIALAGDATTFATFAGFIRSPIGQLLLFGFTWALFHHMLGGVRHALWDVGVGLDHPMRERLAQATLIGGLALTIVVWVVGYVVR